MNQHDTQTGGERPPIAYPVDGSRAERGLAHVRLALAGLPVETVGRDRIEGGIVPGAIEDLLGYAAERGVDVAALLAAAYLGHMREHGARTTVDNATAFVTEALKAAASPAPDAETLEELETVIGIRLAGAVYEEIAATVASGQLPTRITLHELVDADIAIAHSRIDGTAEGWAGADWSSTFVTLALDELVTVSRLPREVTAQDVIYAAHRASHDVRRTTTRTAVIQQAAPGTGDEA